MVVKHRRPRSHVHLLVLTQGVVLQQRLRVFPAGQGSETPDGRGDDVGQARAGRVAEDGALHVRRLQFSPHHLDVAVGADGALRDVERVVVVLGEAEGHGDVVAGHARPDLVHLRRVAPERILDVAIREFDVDGARPGARRTVRVRLELKRRPLPRRRPSPFRREEEERTRCRSGSPG